MRFSASVFIALVGVAAAAPAVVPTSIPSNVVPTGVTTPVTGLLGSTDLVSELTGVAGQVEKGALGVDDLEKKLDACLGSSLVKVESALGQPLAQKLLALVQSGLPPQVVHAVGQGIALVEQGVAIQTVDAYVKGMTDGAATSLEGALGVSDIQKVLQV